MSTTTHWTRKEVIWEDYPWSLIQRESPFFRVLEDEIRLGTVSVGSYLLYESYFEKCLRECNSADDASEKFFEILQLQQWREESELIGFWDSLPRTKLRLVFQNQRFGGMSLKAVG